MNAQVRSELLKLRTTRTIYLLFAGVVAMSIVTVVDPNSTAATFQKPFNEQGFLLFTSMLTRLLIFVLGVRLMTDEFRHGTIVSTFLVSPRRGRVLAAKAVVAGAAGLVLGSVAWLAMTGAASFVASSEGTTLGLDGLAWQTFAAMAGAGLAWGVIGVVVGAIVRNQLVATVGGLIWLMGIEDIFRGILGDIGGYLPGSAGLLMILDPGDGIALKATLMMLVYIALGTFVASKVLRRDVT